MAGCFDLIKHDYSCPFDSRELMGKEKLIELAVVIFQKVKEKASIDRRIKERVRAKLKIAVKRTLRLFGYPLSPKSG